jgi:hypothetical protein
MKPRSPLAGFMVAAILLQSFVTTYSIIDKIGLKEEEAKSYVLNNLFGNFSNNTHPGFVPKDFRLPKISMISAIAGDKTNAAKELCTWIKQYTSSEEFKTLYKQKRASLKPTTTTNNVKPDEETIQMTRESISYMEKDLAQMKKNKSTPAVSIKSVEQQLQQQKDMLKLWLDPNPEVTKWQTLYPEDPQLMVQERLQDYLQVKSTVDFNATLLEADKYGQKKFANPEYEKKDNRWKAVYRAGKEVNDVMEKFARNWISELNAAGKKTSAK